VPFLQKNQQILNLNDTFMQQMESLHQSCGYADYIDKYLTFPASGVQPAILFNASGSNASCDVFDMANDALFAVNPCFDIYEITEMCPILSDVLGFPTELVDDMYNSTYFNRSDVKAALHAPADADWSSCSVEPVFIGGPEVDGYYTGGPQMEGDLAPDPIQHVLPQVIEATNRVLIGNGDYDMIIITNGTLLAIQNMTWNGHLGFQEAPSMPIDITLPDLQYQALFDANGLNGTDGPGQGVMGVQHYERGLMFVETYQSGHMQPEFQPRSSYRHLQWLLGHIETI
jgi:carboxypeptidase D